LGKKKKFDYAKSVWERGERQPQEGSRKEAFLMKGPKSDNKKRKRLIDEKGEGQKDDQLTQRRPKGLREGSVKQKDGA